MQCAPPWRESWLLIPRSLLLFMQHSIVQARDSEADMWYVYYKIWGSDKSLFMKSSISFVIFFHILYILHILSLFRNSILDKSQDVTSTSHSSWISRNPLDFFKRYIFFVTFIPSCKQHSFIHKINRYVNLWQSLRQKIQLYVYFTEFNHHSLHKGGGTS